MSDELQTRLERLLEYWQRRIRLQDWRVKVSVAGPRELDADTAADVVYDLATKTAQIRVRDLHEIDPATRLACLTDDLDVAIESALVHELLHLHFAPIDPGEEDSHDDRAQHQAIHALSFALVELARPGR